MKISVMIPSYRRPESLKRCLEAIRGQNRQADQVLVVMREGDDETLAVLELFSGPRGIESIIVCKPGVVHAMSEGLSRATGDIVALTDDDAAPRPDWLARIKACFSNEATLGGVGGRDCLNQDEIVETGRQNIVGRVLWYGRIVGNHHLGRGAARKVDILKGVNCAFRIEAIGPIGFESRLKGDGAQVHWEMCLCLALKKAGWTLVYDPAIVVDHYPAPRFDRDVRNQFDETATADAAHNFRLALDEISPRSKQLAAFVWHYIVGSQAVPGALSLLRMIAKRDPHALKRYRAASDGFAGVAR